MRVISIYLSIYRCIPESVVSPGIALATSAMAFPWSCILASDTVGADVGVNVGAEEEEEDRGHYFILSDT